MWKAGAEEQLLPPFPGDPLDAVDPVRVPNWCFVYAKQYFEEGGCFGVKKSAPARNAHGLDQYF